MITPEQISQRPSAYQDNFEYQYFSFSDSYGKPQDVNKARHEMREKTIRFLHDAVRFVERFDFPASEQKMLRDMYREYRLLSETNEALEVIE